MRPDASATAKLGRCFKKRHRSELSPLAKAHYYTFSAAAAAASEFSIWLRKMKLPGTKDFWPA